MESTSNSGPNQNEITLEDMKKYPSSSSVDIEATPLNEEQALTVNELNQGDTPLNDNSCKLCLDDNFLPCDMFKLQACQCVFCVKCMKSYVEILVNDGVVLVISCPDADCPAIGKMQESEIHELCDQDIFKKYERLKFEQEVAIDPLRTFCPGVSCSAVCVLHARNQTDPTPSDNSPVTCPKCQLSFCHICKAEWKTEHRCNEFSFSFGSEFQKLQSKAGFNLTNSNIKRCPFCNILIEKDRGCAQMICKNCSHVFCWYCLKLLDNDFMLRHYDKGPCRNMLGHSRAQVYRHRIGVIGLFAAFSLLLVVASPVLLLAAPIILCCKCKEGCQQAINRFNQHNRDQNNFPLEEQTHGGHMVSEDPQTSQGKDPVSNTNDIEIV